MTHASAPATAIVRARYDAAMQNDATSVAAELLSKAQRVCVCTGAGMSAESGVPTFRDTSGLWSKFDPAQLATPEAFVRDPRKVWAWYRERRQGLRQVTPHEGHYVLSRWQDRFAQLTLVTQNVDGLHERAGSRSVLELHGRLDVVRCVRCTYEAQTLEDLGEDPHCAHCGDRVRPGVVWFGEVLPVEALEAAFAAAAACDVLLVVGTSGIVEPAASVVHGGVRRGAKLIEINPNETPYSEWAAASIRSGCRDALKALDARLA